MILYSNNFSYKEKFLKFFLNFLYIQIFYIAKFLKIQIFFL